VIHCASIKMIITVGGSIGSGKSTLARSLARKLGIKYCSVGQIMRDIAKERGLSILDFSLEAEKDSLIDKELDERQKDIVEEAEKSGGCVMDSRLGAYILKPDFAIWLDASPEVQDARISGRDSISIADARLLIARREASEHERYLKIYNIDLDDQSVYDLILNTDKMAPEQVLDACITAIKKRLR